MYVNSDVEDIGALKISYIGNSVILVIASNDACNHVFFKICTQE